MIQSDEEQHKSNHIHPKIFSEKQRRVVSKNFGNRRKRLVGYAN